MFVVNHNIVIQDSRKYLRRNFIVVPAFFIPFIFHVSFSFTSISLVFISCVIIFVLYKVYVNSNRKIIEIDTSRRLIYVKPRHTFHRSELLYIKVETRHGKHSYMYYYLTLLNTSSEEITIMKKGQSHFFSNMDHIKLLAEKISEHSGIPVVKL